MLVRFTTRCNLAVTALLLGAVGPAGAQETVPQGFALETYAEGLDQPIALAFAPDGRLFVGEKGGAIRVVEDGALRAAPFATVEAHTLSECGLLGLALDPEFAQNGWVYCLVTVSPVEQQIIRFREVDGVGVKRTLIRGNLPTNGSNHNGGCLRFGPDGMLYFSIGDTGDPQSSQRMHTFAGKLCRIFPDGSVPLDNPFLTPTGAPRAVYALGFRNPFRFCFAPDGTLYVGDVGSSGPNRREEINRIEAGGNYGWPEVEGFGSASDAAAYLPPLVAYADEGASIAGCAVYAGGQYPAGFAGDLFHLDFVSQRLFRVEIEGTAATQTVFAQLDGGPVDLAVGPDGSLYYCALYTGQVKRLRSLAAAPNDDPDEHDPDEEVLAPAPDLCGSGMTTAAMGLTLIMLGLRAVRGGSLQPVRRHRTIANLRGWVILRLRDLAIGFMIRLTGPRPPSRLATAS